MSEENHPTQEFYELCQAYRMTPITDQELVKKNYQALWDYIYRERQRAAYHVDLYERQPDCGGNRHYDYISLEEHEKAERTLETKEQWDNLTSHEIVVLRAQFKDFGIIPDIVDHCDRLQVLRTLLYYLKPLREKNNDPRP